MMGLELLLGGLTGFLGNIVPEVVQYFKSRQEHQQEIELRRLDMEASKLQAEIGLQIADAKIEQVALEGAYKHQSAKSGIKWIDGLNSLIRPLITLVFFALFCSVIVYRMAYTYSNTQDIGLAFVSIWDDHTRFLFASVMFFWFPHRRIEKRSL